MTWGPFNELRPDRLLPLMRSSSHTVLRDAEARHPDERRHFAFYRARQRPNEGKPRGAHVDCSEELLDPGRCGVKTQEKPTPRPE